MTPPDPTDLAARFQTAAGLPPALSLADATKRFLNPQPLPPPRPWYRNPYVMLVPMLSALALLFLPNTPITPQLTAFPLAEAPVVAEAVTPLPEETYSLVTEPRPLPAGAVSLTPLPKPSSAPAAAPPEVAIRSTSPYVANKPPRTTVQATPDFRYRDLPGLWEYRKKILFLNFWRTDNVPEIAYGLTLRDNERKIITDRANRPSLIRREAGTLMLVDGRRNGQVEFISNGDFRNRLNEAGWGEAAFSGDRLPKTTGGSSLYSDLILAHHPEDLLWFKYFVTDINDKYLTTLRNFGYTSNELKDLWHLANAFIAEEELAEILRFSKANFVDRPPLAQFYGLRDMAARMGYDHQADQKMAYGEFLLSLNANLIGPLVTGPGFIPPVAAPPSPFSGNRPANWGLGTPGVLTDTLISTKPFLSVKGRIRLLLDESVPEGQLIVYRSATAELTVQTRRRKMMISNDCGGERIDIAVNPGSFRGMTTGRCAMMYEEK